MGKQYIFSETLATFVKLAVRRMQAGMGAVLMLTGIPGGGKTAFAKACASMLGAEFFRYQCSPDKERNLLYEIDLDGVLSRENGWEPGPAWEAFEASFEGYTVLLIDELDKAHPNFDSFLLGLLEEFEFRAPGRKTIKADPAKLLVILTSNGRRSLKPELLRRCQRIEVPFPENGRLKEIIRQIAGVSFSDGLLDVVIRVGAAIRKADAENGPSPKEMAFLIIDLLALEAMRVDDMSVWTSVAASYLIKEGGAAAIDKAIPGFKWVRALKNEALKNS